MKKRGAGAYRYGFNGQEKDSEVKGEGAQYDYGFRIYDPRLGRFLSVDPLTKTYPWYTPYQFAGNNPTKFIDLDGLEQAELGVGLKSITLIGNLNFKDIFKSIFKQTTITVGAGLTISYEKTGTEFNALTQFDFAPGSFSLRKLSSFQPTIIRGSFGVSQPLNNDVVKTQSPPSYGVKVNIEYNKEEKEVTAKVEGEGEKGTDFGNENLKTFSENLKKVNDITGTETLPLVPVKQNNVPANNNEQQTLPETPPKIIQLPVQKKPGNTLPTSTTPQEKGN